MVHANVLAAFPQGPGLISSTPMAPYKLSVTSFQGIPHPLLYSRYQALHAYKIKMYSFYISSVYKTDNDDIESKWLFQVEKL